MDWKISGIIMFFLKKKWIMKLDHGKLDMVSYFFNFSLFNANAIPAAPLASLNASW